MQGVLGQVTLTESNKSVDFLETSRDSTHLQPIKTEEIADDILSPASDIRFVEHSQLKPVAVAQSSRNFLARDPSRSRVISDKAVKLALALK